MNKINHSENLVFYSHLYSLIKKYFIVDLFKSFFLLLVKFGSAYQSIVRSNVTKQFFILAWYLFLFTE